MAAKTKTVWYCSECGNKQTKWVGQCPQCQKWNSLHEEVEFSESARYATPQQVQSKPYRLKDISHKETPRVLTKIGEFDRLVGGGIVPGSLMLVGGEPGIGKSTLMLQLSNALATQGLVVLYVSGEESIEQTSMRARRLGIDTDNLLLLAETNMGRIKKHIEQINPDILIVDSIQLVYKEDIASAPGSVTQVRETFTKMR